MITQQHSYDEQFKKDMKKLQRKDKGFDLLELDGIGEQLDVNNFSREFFSTKGTTADVSVDSNANVDGVSVVHYNNEIAKPIHRLNAYYLVWKYGRRLFNEDTAYNIIQKQFSKEIYINDFHGFQSGYSYFGDSLVHVKINGSEKMLKIKKLFELFEVNAYNYGDRKEITDFTEQFNYNIIKKVKIEILDKDNKWVKLTRILKHQKHNKLLVIETKNGHRTIVTEDHPVILENGSNKLAKDITTSDRIMIADNIIREFKGEYIGTSKLGYVIGFILGDGHLTNTSANITQKNFKLTNIEKYLKELGLQYKISSESKFGKTVAQRLSIHNKNFVTFIEDFLQIDRKSYSKNLPTNVFDFNKEFAIGIIEGLMDSDGTVGTQNGQLVIKVNSFSMVQGVKEILKALGITATIRGSKVPKASKNSYRQQYEIFNVGFRLNKNNIKMFKQSNKIKLNHKNITAKKGKDGRFENNKVHIIRELTGKHVDLYDGYVYDITTETGTFYSQGMIQHNCFNFSCMDVVCLGLPFVTKIDSKAPKHLSSYMGQIIQFVTFACNSILGAVGLADLLICTAYFVEKLFDENKDVPRKYLEKQIKQELQSFIYSVNQPFRSAVQSPFTNIGIFDDVFLAKMCDEYVFPNGSKVKTETVKYLQDMFINLMNETLEVTPATFPITTACLAIDENKDILDEGFLKYISKQNLKFGFMNIYAGKTSTLSSCCRLRSEGDNEYFNSFGSGGTKIGSLGVVTLNLPRLAYISKTKEEFLDKLEENVVIAAQVNHTKRFLIQKRVDAGHAPLYGLGFMTLSKQYSTCGIVGVNETLEILGEDILQEEGQVFVEQILDRINDVNNKMAKKYGSPHNVEQVPAENSSIKLATADRILGFNTKYDIYSNQFIPLVCDADIYDRIKIQGRFDKHMTGGAICHLNIVDRITDYKFMVKLIKHSIKQGVIYLAVNYNLQRCNTGHMTVGKNKKCSTCGDKIVDNFTRVVGFLVNTKNWHKVRREVDYPNRKWYKELK